MARVVTAETLTTDAIDSPYGIDAAEWERARAGIGGKRDRMFQGVYPRNLPVSKFELAQYFKDGRFKSGGPHPAGFGEGVPLLTAFNAGEAGKRQIGKEQGWVFILIANGHKDGLLAMLETPPLTLGVVVVGRGGTIRAGTVRVYEDERAGLLVMGRRVTDHEQSLSSLHAREA